MVVLPFTIPPIKYVNYIAFELGITLNMKGTLPWYYMNYTQLCCKKEPLHSDNNKLKFSMLHNPFLDKTSLPIDFVKDLDSTLHFIKVSLRHGYYIKTSINEFFIKTRTSYRRKSFTHDIMIHGFDDSDETFHVSGYNNKRVFSMENVPYANILDAFMFCHNPTRRLFELIRPVEKEVPFNKTFFTESILNYFNGSNTAQQKHFSIQYQVDHVFGMDVYKYIIDFIYQNNQILDLRLFRSLLEHKIVMVERVKYVMENNYIPYSESLIEKFNVVLTKAQILFNFILKLLVKERPVGKEERQHLVIQLNVIVDNESIALEKLLNSLNQGL